MRLTKAQRRDLFAKFGGKCAYCGCPLGERWHADHIESVGRMDWLGREPMRPERHTVENHNPSCAPCNISKGPMPLEAWRDWLAGHVNSLNRHHSIYRLCKAFGLVAETGAPVVFYFERAKDPTHD